MTLKTTVQAWVTRVMHLKPIRVFQHYGARRGPLLSQGLSYQAIFAVFAALWVGFSVFGTVLQSQPQLLSALVDLLDTYVPGIFDDGSGTGVIDPDQIVQSVPFTLTGIIALVVLLFTATGWLSSGREAVRALFGLPGAELNPVLAIAKDLGLALAFGASLLLSAVLSIASTSATTTVLGWIGVDGASDVAVVATRAVGILLMLALDALILALFYRIVSGISIPFRLLWQGALLGAIALGALKVLGTALLGGATSNPLLASFAVIIGLLIWFNLVCQVILIGAAWIAVGAEDAGLDLHGRRSTKAGAAKVGATRADGTTKADGPTKVGGDS